MSSLSSDTVEERYQIITVKYHVKSHLSSSLSIDLPDEYYSGGVCKVILYSDSTVGSFQEVEELSIKNGSEDDLNQILSFSGDGSPFGQLELVVGTKLAQFVNIFMANGWVPCGSPIVSTCSKNYGNYKQTSEVYLATQAMIKVV